MTNQDFLKTYKSKIIYNLINEKDNIANEINDIASYIDTQYNETDLTSEEVNEINRKRKEILFIYNLINKIEDIREV